MSLRVWTMAILHLRAALLARGGMRDAEASQAVRDECTDRYCRSVDDLVDCLETLSEAKVLGAITDLLAGRGRT
jgi:hypothetical protein